MNNTENLVAYSLFSGFSNQVVSVHAKIEFSLYYKRSCAPRSSILREKTLYTRLINRLHAGEY